MPGKSSRAQEKTALEPVSDGTTETPSRFGAPEATVITVLVVTAAALAHTGMAPLTVLQLLLGAGLIGAATITFSHARPGKRLLKVLRALLGAPQ
ncbi:hypothetical protein [Streptomyces sp. NPDC002159]